jgi:hypothetical protein
MAERGPGDALVAWALGTFHTLAFGLAALVLAQGQGGLGLLQELGTLLGVVLAVILWLLTVWATGRALGEPPYPGAGASGLLRSYLRGLLWAGIEGVSFFGALLAIAFLIALVEGDASPGTSSPSAIGGVFILYIGLGGIAAFIIGVVMGAVVGLLDLAVFGAARWLAGRIAPGPDPLAASD